MTSGTDDTDEPTGGTGPGHREVTLTRTAVGRYDARNVRGGTIHLGPGDGPDFTPVELFLVALAGCSAVDVDHLTSRRAEPTGFEVRAQGEKISDDGGNRMTGIELTFTLRFPDGEAGDRARSMVERGLRVSHERLCTVSRTVELGEPVTMTQA